MIHGFTRIQWKIADGWMDEANLAAPKRKRAKVITNPASREIAEYHLNRYFDVVEAELSLLRQQDRP
jgi:hypothetical protein